MDRTPIELRTPHLVADVRLYPTEEGGKTIPARKGYGCPCFISKDFAQDGWDARLQLDEIPFEPGTARRVGFVFIHPEGAVHMKEAGRFFLWDGRFVGEAEVVV